MNIEECVGEAFAAIGKVPRGNQTQIAVDVVTAFITNGKRNVVLNAPTGVGKSVLGGVISYCVDRLIPGDALASVVGMGTNSLAKQYTDTYSELGDYKYFAIKGASNYPCAFMEAQPSATVKTADECVRSRLIEQEVERYCNRCEFRSAQKMVNVTENLITNFTYMMISAFASDHLKPRKLHTFDEAHTLNDAFCSFSEIQVSVDTIDRYIKELGDTNGKCDSEIAGLIMLKQKISSGGVGDNNYMSVLGVLQKLYLSVGGVLSFQSLELMKHDIVRGSKYSKMSKKYIAAADSITRLIEQEYEHVFDASIPNTFSVKPIFMGQVIDSLLTTKNLFMSATITQQCAFEIIGLNPDETAFIELDPVFPPENKPIFFIGKAALNYNSLKDPETIAQLKKQVSLIAQHHDGEKGILLAPSFFLGSQLVNDMGKVTRVFEHRSGGNVSKLLQEYKRYSGSALFVSPSAFEGLDIPESSYCIIVKVPFASLGDKRIAYIATHHPKVYQEMGLLKILQGIGRSVRSPTDTAVTYMLDLGIEKLYNSKLNIWKNHYDVQGK